VDGTAQLGLFNAGGKAPESASLRLSGGRILLVDGQAFRKGETIRFSGTAVVREVAQRDKPDSKTGIVVSAEQKHVAQITDLRVRCGTGNARRRLFECAGGCGRWFMADDAGVWAARLDA
jgi:hypothetical protein